MTLLRSPCDIIQALPSDFIKIAITPPTPWHQQIGFKGQVEEGNKSSWVKVKACIRASVLSTGPYGYPAYSEMK